MDIDRNGPLPLAVQIAHALAGRIRSGALRPGQSLPSTREFSGALGVHRNTVVAAYAELESEGWIVSRQGRGTFVADAFPVPDTPRRRGTSEGPAGFELPPGPPMPPQELIARSEGMLELLGGLPDPRLLPSLAIARAYRRALRDPSNLGYGDSWGHRRLRDALTSMLGSTRGMAVEADRIVVTRGAQMALSLAAHALLRPGDAVAVEHLGYPPAWQAFHLAGLRLIAVPVDEHGLCVDRLAGLLARERIRAVYLTPHHQYPTTVTLTPGRRLALLELARREKLLLIEDDYDNELHFEGRPVLPLASLEAGNQVAYIGTLSKVLAPGLRLGFIAAPREAAQRLAAHRFYTDRQGDRALEQAVAWLFEEGEVQRHVWRLRRICQRRRDALAEALDAHLGRELTFRIPSGGMAIWCRVSGGIDVDAWASRAWKRGLAVQTSRQVSMDPGPSTHLRLGFARHDESELQRAVRLLAGAMSDKA